MTITITAFEESPDQGQGQARDMRVRWALEEVGQPYDVRLVSFQAMKEAPHLSRHPFGQIPTYEEGDLVLFESGAIVFHIAQRHAGLLPDDANARARAITWMFAALSTVEPPIVELEAATLIERDKPWYADRLPMLDDRVRKRLDELSARLGDAEWLDGAFSAGDLLMVTVLRRLEGSGILEDYPSLCAYVDRGRARPAYKRAFAAQLASMRRVALLHLHGHVLGGGSAHQADRRGAGLSTSKVEHRLAHGDAGVDLPLVLLLDGAPVELHATAVGEDLGLGGLVDAEGPHLTRLEADGVHLMEQREDEACRRLDATPGALAHLGLVGLERHHLVEGFGVASLGVDVHQAPLAALHCLEACTARHGDRGHCRQEPSHGRGA